MSFSVVQFYAIGEADHWETRLAAWLPPRVGGHWGVRRTLESAASTATATRRKTLSEHDLHNEHFRPGEVSFSDSLSSSLLRPGVPSLMLGNARHPALLFTPRPSRNQTPPHRSFQPNQPKGTTRCRAKATFANPSRARSSRPSRAVASRRGGDPGPWIPTVDHPGASAPSRATGESTCSSSPLRR